MYEPRTDKHAPKNNKVCVVCSIEYLPTIGAQKRCPKCRISDKERSRTYYFTNREKVLDRTRVYYQTNKVTLRPKKAAYARGWAKRTYVRISTSKRKQAKAIIRRNILHKILGYYCVKCGFDDLRALQFDHINSGGHKRALELGSTESMYDYYIVNPDIAKSELQVLCANCNWIKRHDKREGKTHLKY